MTAYLEQGRIPAEVLVQMAMFFHLQRYLGKWGGEYEPEHGKAWRIFRTLFLAVVNEPVPPLYQLPDYYQEWLYNYEPFRQQCIEIVRHVHETIVYDDEAKPDLAIS